MVLLLPLCFIAIATALFRLSPQLSLREIFLRTSVITGLLILFSCEALSLFKAITFPNLVCFWLVVLLLSLWKIRESSPQKFPSIPSLSLFERCVCYSCLILIFIMGLVACFGITYTWDAMAYHMARVVHWEQNRSVFLYPTTLPLQLYTPPFAEYVLLHLYILGDGDHWVNLASLFAMLGSCLGVSLIAKEFGANRLGQMVAFVLSVSLPIAIGQATSTKNDLIMAFWIVTFVYFLCRLNKEFSWGYVLLAGTSLGLSFLTKGTAYLYGLPFIVAFIITARLQLRFKALTLIVCLLLSLVINSFCYVRMASAPVEYNVTQNWLFNKKMNLPLFISNTVRNISQQISFPSQNINLLLYEKVLQLHQALGLDLRDSHITFAQSYFFIIPYKNQQDMETANSWHMIIIITFAVLFFFCKNKIPLSGRIYFYTLIGVFILLNLVLKWQKGGSRFYMTWFILFSPILGQWLGQYKKLGSLIAALFIISALPRTLFNTYTPFMGTPKSLYSYYVPYWRAVHYIEDMGCSEIGIHHHWPDSQLNWEYPYWMALRETGKPFRLEHIRFDNEPPFKEGYPLGNFDPCAIIIYEKKDFNGRVISFHNKKFERKKKFRNLFIFLPTKKARK
jgi:hypothetical protein